jgi:hypothetical protein
MCSVAVWDTQCGGCFVFDCGSSAPEESKCRFTGNEAFTSGALLSNRRAFDAGRWDLQSTDETNLKDPADENRSRMDTAQPGAQYIPAGTSPDQASSPHVCGRYEFSCLSGECIAVYDVCNGVPQCSDGSDEDPAVCPTVPLYPTSEKVAAKSVVVPPTDQSLDSDLVMETPLTALFALILGSLFFGVMCAVMICSCRAVMKAPSRKRKLASDAEGDYLVNGMYL